MDGKWIARTSEETYRDEWTAVSITDVELPDGKHIDYSVIHLPGSAGAAVTLAHNNDKCVLMIWRHRFIGDRWGWELPAGCIEEHESPETGAAREMLEETGWKPGKLHQLVAFPPIAGRMKHDTYVFTTNEATWVGPDRDLNESADIAWLSLAEIRSLMKKGDISEGSTLVALLWAMQFGPLLSAS